MSDSYNFFSRLINAFQIGFVWLLKAMTVCIFVTMSCAAYCQSAIPRLVTGSYNNLSVDQFLKTLEKQTGYHFYYDSTRLDSINITLSVKEQPLAKVLELAFKNTGTGFSVDDNDNVFVNKGLLVQTELRKDFETVKNGAAKDTGMEYLSNGKSATTSETKLYVIGESSTQNNLTELTIAGYVRESKTGEPVMGAYVYIDNMKTAVATDQYGYFIITVNRGRHTLYIQSIGMYDTKRQVMVYSNGKLNVDMQSQVMTLRKVTVSTEKTSNVRSLQMGVQKIDIKTIKQVPVVFGEADVLRVLLTMPGVKSVGEASTGLNVRGGSADQNLILFNDATIYNPSHFFGFFSAFNPEVVKDAELFKSSIPAQYGGRLSSVINISSREGNKKNITGSAGIGLLTSRLNIEGPLIKDKSTFIIGARTTYADWLLKLLPDEYKDSKAGFYDFNMVINHEINKKNTLYLTGYLSNDRFNLNSDTAYRYGNSNASLKWKHIFTNKLYALSTIGYDYYHYNIQSTKNQVTAYTLGFNISQSNFKMHFNYNVSNKQSLQFGISSIYYKLHPGSYQPYGKESIVRADVMQPEQGLESAAYFSEKYNVNSALSFEAGVRYSLFNYMGPGTINNYAPGVPKTEDNRVNTSNYGSGKFIKTYGGPEVRLSGRYALTNTLSVKAGYNTQRQYIHVLSNTTAVAPTDIWKLSDPNIKPQSGNQVSLGLYKNFKANTIETSAEIYYKKINDYLDYKSGAMLVLNHHIETDVIGTKGKAYGVEVLLKKATGKFNGWISYTYSRTLLKADSSVGEIINGGRYYPASYDKPHDVTFIGNYRVNHRFSLSLNATYSTGRAITLPIGRFYYSGAYRTLYGDRNSFRIPDYFRSDFSMNIDGNHKVKQKTHNSFTLGVYNITGRKNPYSVYFISENGAVNGYKLSIFGSAIPYINYNIRF